MSELTDAILADMSSLAPLEDILKPLEAYFHLGFTDKQLEEYLKDHYDTELYGLGYVSYIFVLLYSRT